MTKTHRTQRAPRFTSESVPERESRLPWSRADYRNRVLRIVREYVPQLLQELDGLCVVESDRDRERAVTVMARKWDLATPWISRTMHRTVRYWLRAPQMRARLQWAPVLPHNGWGHRLLLRRRVEQRRGMNSRPHGKVQTPSVFTWWVRYHLLGDSYCAIAVEEQVELSAVRMAVARLRVVGCEE